jgi:hypothetical protein
MNVGELKEALKDVDDSIPVLTPAYDHSYIVVEWADLRPVERSAGWSYHEFYDEKNMFDGSTKIQGFIIDPG